MEDALRGNDYLLGSTLNIADIALFAYTHVASEGGFDLSNFPNIVKWIARIQSRTGYISMASK